MRSHVKISRFFYVSELEDQIFITDMKMHGTQRIPKGPNHGYSLGHAPDGTEQDPNKEFIDVPSDWEDYVPLATEESFEEAKRILKAKQEEAEPDFVKKAKKQKKPVQNKPQQVIDLTMENSDGVIEID